MIETALPDWISVLTPSDPAAHPDQTALFAPLAHRGLLAWEGEDAVRFLQGQLTCDVNALQTNQLTLGACCDPKGRMLASFYLINTGQAYVLDMGHELIAPLQDALNKYAMLFRKLEAHDASDEFHRLAIWGSGAENVLLQHFSEIPTEPGSVVEHDGARLLRLTAVHAWQLWLPPQQSAEWLQDLSQTALLVEPRHWLTEEIRAGLGWVDAHSSGRWIPQMLNYTELGGISFSKGCYTGQEIIARLHYRGEQKRHCRHLQAEGRLESLPDAGTALTDGAGKTVGELVSIVRTGPEQAELLAVLQANMDPAGTIQLSGLKLRSAGN